MFTRKELNDRVVDVLLNERLRSGCSVLAYCLMPDHLHLVAAPTEVRNSVLTFVACFKSISTRTSWRFGLSGKLWQPRCYDHVIRYEENLVGVCEYILANPARAGLVENPSEYPWCGFVDPISV